MASICYGILFKLFNEMKTVNNEKQKYTSFDLRVDL